MKAAVKISCHGTRVCVLQSEKGDRSLLREEVFYRDPCSVGDRLSASSKDRTDGGGSIQQVRPLAPNVRAKLSATNHEMNRRDCQMINEQKKPSTKPSYNKFLNYILFCQF